MKTHVKAVSSIQKPLNLNGNCIHHSFTLLYYLHSLKIYCHILQVKIMLKIAKDFGLLPVATPLPEPVSKTGIHSSSSSMSHPDPAPLNTKSSPSPGDGPGSGGVCLERKIKPHDEIERYLSLSLIHELLKHHLMDICSSTL